MQALRHERDSLRVAASAAEAMNVEAQADTITVLRQAVRQYILAAALYAMRAQVAEGELSQLRAACEARRTTW